MPPIRPAKDYNYSFFRVTFPADHVAHVEIDRPQKLNAFKDPMWQNLASIFTQLSSDPNVRAVILSGNGEKAFTAGLDVESASTEGPLASTSPNTDAARRAFHLRRYILWIQDTITAIERCEKPVIVVMHGYSYGLAIDISCCADIRICASNTLFSVKETEIGLAADVGTLTRLPKLGLSLSWVKELCYTSRVFGAEEALAHGLVSHVAPSRGAAVQRAVETAVEIAKKSPVAVQGTKNLIDYSRDHSRRDGLEYTAIWNAAMLQTRDVTDAMRSGLGKTTKTPTFEKL